jgi:hypothetical protein
MGACATKPLEIMNRAPEEVPSTPRSAEVTATSADTTTAQVIIYNIFVKCKQEFCTMNDIMICIM